MSRIALVLLVFCTCFSAFSQAPVTQKLDILGVKNAVVSDKPSSLIIKMYRFDENRIKGAIIVFTLRELKLDVFAVILQSGASFTVQSIEAVNPKAFGTVMMGRIKASLARWDNMKDSAIPDAVSSSTKYAKAAYTEIGEVANNAIALLKKY